MDGIQQKCKKYSVTQKVIDTAKILYKKISDCKHDKGERKGKSIIMRCINRRSMIAACVFYACKLENEPRSPKEIADIYDLEVKHVNRGCRKFVDFIDINSYFNKIKSSNANDFITRYSSNLNLSKEVIDMAKNVSDNIHKLDIASTHEPPSVAAGSILLVCNLLKIDINKKLISTVFEISDVTISKTYRKIYPYHKIIMDNDITEYIADKVTNLEKNNDSINLENIIVTEESKPRVPKKPKEFIFKKLEPINNQVIMQTKNLKVDL
jgi:transcription initiation factor TFIIIB Brf1 subunit/transcription initiation factor TFIIB